MRIELRIVSATAIGLILSTGAYADGNNAFIAQSGDGNAASITQSSSATNGNNAGRVGDAMSQSGNGNVLTIVQDGDDGEIGVKQGMAAAPRSANCARPRPARPSATARRPTRPAPTRSTTSGRNSRPAPPTPT